MEDGGSRLPGRLERGDIDVAHMPAGDARFSSRSLHPMHVLAVLPRGHRLSRRAVLDVTELADEPLLRLGSSFASHGWFEAACQVAHIRPRVLLESVVPQTLIALARTGHGVAVVPSPVRISRAGVRAAVVVHRGGVDRTMGRRCLDLLQRFLPPYAVQFVDELVAHCRRGYPGHEYGRRAPALPRPREPISCPDGARRHPESLVRSRLFGIHQYEQNSTRLRAAIDPGVVGRLLDHHIARLHVHCRLVEHHVDFAGKG